MRTQISPSSDATQPQLSLTTLFTLRCKSRRLYFCSAFGCQPSTKESLLFRSRISTHVAEAPIFFQSLSLPNSGDSKIFGFPSSDIEYLGVIDPNCHAIILGNFDAYNREWPVHSSNTLVVRREAEQLALANNLYQSVDHPTRIPDRPGDCCSWCLSHTHF